YSYNLMTKVSIKFQIHTTLDILHLKNNQGVDARTLSKNGPVMRFLSAREKIPSNQGKSLVNLSFFKTARLFLASSPVSFPGVVDRSIGDPLLVTVCSLSQISKLRSSISTNKESLKPAKTVQELPGFHAPKDSIP
ncbi:hypothetical protein STEG23_001446, partial [Scotinomys teguina]